MDAVQPRRGCGTWVRCWPRVSPAVIDIQALRAFKPRLLRVSGISAGLARPSGIAFNPSGGLRLVARGMVLNVQPRRGHRGIIASDLYLSVIYQVLIFSLPTVGMLSIPSVQLCVILQPKFQNITTLLPNSVTIGTSVCLIFASSNINKTI